MRASQASASAMRSTCSDGGSARSIVVPMRSSSSVSPAARAQCKRVARVVEVRLAAAQPVVDADAAAEVLVVGGIEQRRHGERVAALQRGALAGASRHSSAYARGVSSSR